MTDTLSAWQSIVSCGAQRITGEQHVFTQMNNPYAPTQNTPKYVSSSRDVIGRLVLTVTQATSDW